MKHLECLNDIFPEKIIKFNLSGTGIYIYIVYTIIIYITFNLSFKDAGPHLIWLRNAHKKLKYELILF